MNGWTLTCNGTESTFEALGFTEPRMQPRKLAVTTFTVRIPGASNLVADPPVAFKAQVIIRRGRVSGEGGISGGEIVFQGRQITDKRIASQTPGDVLTFGDAWWDLENTVFQQQWKYWDNGTQTGLSRPFCGLNLFQDFASGYVITNGAQLTEIITWAIACGVQLQVGTIDLAWYIQPYPASALSCASAIQVCLKPSPGSACWIDMTTTPPTLNCRERYYHQALSLPYASGNHRSSELMPRYDMQVPQVVLQYSKGMHVTIGGVSSSWTIFPYDAWPPDSTLASGVRGGKQVGAMVVPIHLADFTRTDVVQKVTATAFGSPPSLGWWKSKKAAMAAYTDLAYVASSLKILDASGTDITSTVLSSYPNELVDGQVASWMVDAGTSAAIGVQEVTVQAAFTYTENDPNGIKTHTVGPGHPHVISVKVRLTNSAIGVQSYSLTTSLDTGQEPVANLAQYIWTMLSWLFWDGTHSISEVNAAGVPDVTQIIDCRYALNLTGGATAWATMLSPVHAVDIDFTRGSTDIQFGLPKHVGPAELEELCQFYKFRRRLDNVNLRSTGNSGDSGSTEVGGSGAKENTSDSMAPSTFYALSSPVEGGPGAVQRIEHDAEGGEIALKIVDTSGDPASGFAQVSLKLGDLMYAD